MKKAALVCLILSLLIFAIAGWTWIKGNYEYEATVGAEWSLADKSSTIPAKAQHLDKLDRKSVV